MMNKKMWIAVVVCLGWSIVARADDAAVPKTHPDFEQLARPHRP